MRISISKSEVMVLSGKPLDCLLWVGNESLPQVKEFKYLCVLFTSEGVRSTGKSEQRVWCCMRFTTRL